MPQRFILGPQRPEITLDLPFRELRTTRPVAVISAGWQEAENDIDDLRGIIGQELHDLELYRRAEDLFASDPDFHAGYRRRQDRLQSLQRLHRIRLRQAARAMRQLLREEGDDRMLRHEQRHAMSQLRVLDRHHLRSVANIHRNFEAEVSDKAQALIAGHVADIERRLAESDVVLITGGNVVVLLNRLRLFQLGDLLRDKTIVAWSAGAMILTDRIVLYHDRTPLEYRDAEILGGGLGLMPGLVLLPDARHRLRDNDRMRVSLMCRRFSPAACVTLDNGAILRFSDDRYVSGSGARRLLRNGKLRKVRAR